MNALDMEPGASLPSRVVPGARVPVPSGPFLFWAPQQPIDHHQQAAEGEARAKRLAVAIMEW